MRASAPGHTVMAGVVTALVGFTSSFAVVLAGLQQVGATPGQAASGLLALCVTMGLGTSLFAWRTRLPITIAWSTPGAALLAGTALPAGGFPAAVGAFVLVGVLIGLCGLLPPLERLVESIPASIANAMLAGVLLGLVVQPFRDLVRDPAAIAPVILTWLLLMRLARRWAVPGALVAAVVVMVARGAFAGIGPDALVPHVELVRPTFDVAAMIAIAVPVWLVTMTSQNIPGMAVLRSFGYRPRLRPALVYTGAATAAGAPFGGHAINLAAISAALAAGPEAHEDPDRRWVAAFTAGLGYLVLGLVSAAVAIAADAAPVGLIAAIAGLALIPTFASATASALEEAGTREAAAITLVVSASGLSAWGVGAAFWGLVAGGVWLGLMALRRPPSPLDKPPPYVKYRDDVTDQ